MFMAEAYMDSTFFIFGSFEALIKYDYIVSC